MTSAPQLTLITHVYNAQALVDQHLARWHAYAPELLARLQFLIVDDCSDTPLRADRGPLNLRLLRVQDDIPWNMAGCRNLAAVQADAPWLLYFDVDNTTSEASILRLVNALPVLDAARLYVFNRTLDGQPVEPHINTYLVSRRGYFQAGGYDEDFCGHYGYEDVLFRNMWRRHVGQEILLTDLVFEERGHRTGGLNRDTHRNQALLHAKALAGFVKPKGMLRFAWEEVHAAPETTVPALATPAGEGAVVA